jgi:hypothetical protein
LRFERRTLANGLRLAATRRSKGESPQLFLFVRGGSSRDPVGKKGLAHLIEHLFTRWLSADSHSVRGRTLFDCTEYLFVRIQNLEELLRQVASSLVAVRSETFPIQLVRREILRVCDEIQASQSYPNTGKLYETLYRTAFTASQYRGYPLGLINDVSQIAPSQCSRVTSRYYVPENMLLFYRGPSSPSAFIDLADKIFSPLVPDSPIPRLPKLYSDQTALRRTEVSSPDPTHRLLMGFMFPGLDRLSIGCFHVVKHLVFYSPFGQDPRIKGRSYWAFPLTLQPALFEFFADFSGEPAFVEKLIWDSCEILTKRSFIRDHLELSKGYLRKKLAGSVGMWPLFELTRTEASSNINGPELLAGVNESDVLRLTRRIFRKARATIVTNYGRT